jgi:hypothetical protein
MVRLERRRGLTGGPCLGVAAAASARHDVAARAATRHSGRHMGQPIRLKYGMSVNFSPGGGFTGVNSTQVIAKVENLAFEKEVAVGYVDAAGNWAERPLAWQKNFGDHDLFTRDDGTFSTTRYAFRYSVGGATFWDNDGGADYRAGHAHPNAVGGRIALGKAVARRGTQAGGGFVFQTSWMEGEILVENVAFAKRVGIRLSRDGWATFHDTDASFGGPVPVPAGASRVEVWKFKTPELNLESGAPDFRFAVYFNDLQTGAWFWDNNFGRDYRLARTDGTTAE